MSTRSRLLGRARLLAPLGVVFVCGTARAADPPSDSKAADVLFENARAAMSRGDLA